MNAFSNRTQQVKISPTVAVSMRAAELKAAGHDIISLSIGEPDFDTPEHIKAAGIKAIQDGFTKYTSVDGTPGLKKAVIKKFATENHLNYDLKQIVVSCGVKHGLYNLFQAVLNPGDEVVIPAPYWVSYPDMALLAEATPVFIPTDIKQQFKIKPKQLEAAITPKTRLLILNSPSNPSGMVYSETELRGLAEVLLNHPRIIIASDDMYEHILWTKEPFHNILNVCPELYDRTVVFNGVSKAYAMTGWRIGYAGGPANIIKTMVMIQSQNTSAPCSISQVAAQAALEGDQSCIGKMMQEFKQRHDYICSELGKMPGFICHPSDGTFYTLPNVEGALKKLDCKDDLAFSELLLNDAGIAVVPGSAFGADNCIRISYATSMKNLTEAVARLKKILSACKVD